MFLIASWGPEEEPALLKIVHLCVENATLIIAPSAAILNEFR